MGFLKTGHVAPAIYVDYEVGMEDYVGLLAASNLFRVPQLIPVYYPP